MSDTRTYYYARVSSRDQNLARQLEAFRVLGADERSIITDQESGKDLNRPGYMALKNAILGPETRWSSPRWIGSVAGRRTSRRSCAGFVSSASG